MESVKGRKVRFTTYNASCKSSSRLSMKEIDSIVMKKSGIIEMMRMHY